MAMSWQLKSSRERNRPMAKMPADQLEQALAAHDRIQAVSDEIRTRHGLPLVPESPALMAARGRLVQLREKGKGKRVTASKRRTVKARELTPDERLAAVAARRVQLRRELAESDREVCELRDSKAVGVSKIAKRLGVSRQAVYQLSGAGSVGS